MWNAVLDHADAASLRGIFAVSVIFKISLLLAFGWLATAVMRRQSASARHAVWALTLMGTIAIPVAMLTLPGWGTTRILDGNATPVRLASNVTTQPVNPIKETQGENLPIDASREEAPVDLHEAEFAENSIIDATPHAVAATTNNCRIANERGITESSVYRYY